MKKLPEPKVLPEHWATLPFCVSEIQARNVTIYTPDTKKFFDGQLSVTRHPERGDLASLVVVIDRLPTGAEGELNLHQSRVRPRYLTTLRQLRAEIGDYAYHLQIPESQLSEVPLPRQRYGK
jgi:hypothetical protein